MLPRRSRLALPAQPEPLPAWRTIQSELRRRVGDSTYEIWLAPLRFHSWDGEVLELDAPGATRAWVTDRFGRVLDQCVTDVLGEQASVSFAGDKRGAARSTSPPPDAAPAAGFNPRYSFEQFVIGGGNRLAHGAALAVAELPRAGLQPALPPRPSGPWQDPSAARDRQLRGRVRRGHQRPVHDRRIVHQPLHRRA